MTVQLSLCRTCGVIMTLLVLFFHRFSLEEKQGAMRDLIKKEKVLRSESKLAEMVDLIGPKGRVGRTLSH